MDGGGVRTKSSRGGATLARTTRQTRRPGSRPVDGGSNMKLTEFSTPKGGPVWVNTEMVLYVGLIDGAGASMYGDNNRRTGAKIYFAQATGLEVKESVEEVVSRLTA